VLILVPSFLWLVIYWYICFRCHLY
jgi:hypothetical protein